MDMSSSYLSLLLLLLLQLPFILYAQPCLYNNGLDLSALRGSFIQCIATDNSPYILTPCESSQRCGNFDIDQYMIIQSTLSNLCQAGLAKFDEGVQPQSITVDGQQAFKFQYIGEASFDCRPDPRITEVTFVCDPSADPYDPSSSSCGEFTNNICNYWFTIYTKFGCIGSGSMNDESSGLSTGSVVLVLLLVAVVVYCVGGYLFNGYRNDNEDGKWTDFSNNTPNLSFWKLFIQLVIAGCGESIDWIKGKMDKEGKTRSDTYSELDDVASTSEYQ